MPQPDEGGTYAEKSLKSEATVDWRDPAAAIERRLRAFTPFPGMAFARGGETIKLKACRLAEGAGAPGTVLASGGRLVVACGEGAIECLELQRAGKPAMEAGRFLQSLPIAEGEVLP